MDVRVDVRVERNRIPKMTGEVRVKARDAVRDVSMMLQDAIEAGFAVVSRRIPASVQREQDDLVATVGVSTDSPFHAGFIEYGTIDMPPTPIATPAAEDHRQKFIDELTEAMRSLG